MNNAWIIGTDPEGAHEFIVHRHAPRFIASVDEDENIHVIDWIDPAPDPAVAARLLQDAATALEIYTQDSFE